MIFQKRLIKLSFAIVVVLFFLSFVTEDQPEIWKGVSIELFCQNQNIYK